MSPVATYHAQREFIKEWLFDGGMNRSALLHQIADGECRLIENAYYPRETRSPRTRPGMVQYDAGDLTTETLEAITGLHIYQGGGSGGASTFIVATATHTTGTKQGLYYLDTDEKWVAISSDLGSLVRPYLCTYGGYLLVAIAGQYIKLWNGYTGSDPAPARATGTITVATYSNVAIGETLTVGTRQFTFQTTRVQPGEITIGGSNNAMATNINAAIATDCWDVSATVLNAVVTVTSRETGTIGNSIPLVDGTGGMTLSGATLSGGVNGVQLDTIDSYGAPKPGLLAVDKNLRIIGAGDTTGGTLLDRLYFSAPSNVWQWATGEYGDGEYWDIGYREGNAVSAVCPHLGELMIHKSGANKEIFRLDISNPDPATWNLQRRFFSGATAAVNQWCAVSAADKHMALDADYFRVFAGNDAFDELRSGIESEKVADYLINTASNAFIAINPREIYAMIFPAAGASCLIYHYGTGRWCYWTFPTTDAAAAAFSIKCAVYSETLGMMLLGCSDGHVYKLDPDYSADFGHAFMTTIIGQAVTGQLQSVLLKMCSLEYENHLAGSGALTMLGDLNESIVRAVIGSGDFVLVDTALRVYEATMEVYAATFDFADKAFSSLVSRQEAKAPMLAPKITFTGAGTINNLVARIAQVGLKGEA